MKRELVILTGFMGTGKTTVGKIVAGKLGWKFYDLDIIVGQRERRSIFEIFKQKGEAYFRQAETEILKELLDNQKAVLATGGGTLLSSKNRLLANNCGEVFCLTASPEETKRRLTKYKNRPLLYPNGTIQEIRELRKVREPIYKSFVNQLDTTSLSPSQAAELILQQLKTSSLKLTVEFKKASHTCEVLIEANCLRIAGKLVKTLNPSQVFVLTDTTVKRLYYKELDLSLKRAGFAGRFIIIPDGERFKRLKSLSYGYDFLVKHKADRNSLLVTLGGGVITDLGGMLAATYVRGIKLAHIPSTLLAQVDAAIGGKTAVNHPQAKNAIGCFYQPNLILIDPTLAETLSQRHFLNGLAEVIKIALITDPPLFKFLKKNIQPIVLRETKAVNKIITQAVKKKIEITTKDPQEQNLRKILNFGHTLAHAWETHHKYRNIPHGEAVGLGMLVALQLSADLKIGNLETLNSVKDLLERVGLPTNIKKLDTQSVWQIMYLDKKAGYGKINFVLLEKIGKPAIKTVEFSQFKRACRILA